MLLNGIEYVTTSEAAITLRVQKSSIIRACSRQWKDYVLRLGGNDRRCGTLLIPKELLATYRKYKKREKKKCPSIVINKNIQPEDETQEQSYRD